MERSLKSKKRGEIYKLILALFVPYILYGFYCLGMLLYFNDFNETLDTMKARDYEAWVGVVGFREKYKEKIREVVWWK